MSDFKQLQPRNGHKLSAAFQKKLCVTTNLYEIRCDKLPQLFYRYDIVTLSDQQLQPTSIEFRQLSEKKDKFFKAIDHIYSNAKYYIGLVKTEETHQIIDRTNFKKIVTLSKTYNLQQLLSDLGISLGLRKLIGPQIDKLGKKHLVLQEEQFMKSSIFIQPKISYDFIIFKEKYYLSTNIQLKINEGESLVKYFSIYDQQSLKLMLIGRMVVTNYGQPKVYKIKDIDFTKTSLTQANLQNKTQTFSDYFKQKYTFQIRNPNFALLVVTAKYGNSQRTIFLPPETASLYNDINANKPEEGTKSKIKKRKLLLPQQKQPSTLKIIGQLSDSEVIKKSALNLDAWKLKSPSIRFQSTNRSIEPLEGIFPIRGKISRPIDIFNWGIAYVPSSNKETDSKDLGSLIYCMRTVCSQYGIKITNESGYIPVQGDFNNWKKLIKEDVAKYGAPQFLIFFLSEQESKFYPNIKEYAVKQLKFQTQVVKRKIFTSESKRQFSITGDILLQINAKIGGILWQVSGDNELSKRKLMVGAYTIKKDEKGYKISFVGSLNAQSTNYYSISKQKIQQLKQITLQDYIICWAKNYVMSNRCPPEVIIVYREVCSSLENKEMISSDIQKIKGAIKTIGQKTKIANYKPDIAVITVDQTNSMELYSRGQNQDEIGNPKAGTVVRQEAQNLFYLVSSEDYFATTKCMKYKIQQSSEIDHEDLFSLTYDQCYNYFNFKGSLNYPACLQYAYKLMKFTDTTGVELNIEDKMTNRLYYL